MTTLYSDGYIAPDSSLPTWAYSSTNAVGSAGCSGDAWIRFATEANRNGIPGYSVRFGAAPQKTGSNIAFDSPSSLSSQFPADAAAVFGSASQATSALYIKATAISPQSLRQVFIMWSQPIVLLDTRHIKKVFGRGDIETVSVIGNMMVLGMTQETSIIGDTGYVFSFSAGAVGFYTSISDIGTACAEGPQPTGLQSFSFETWDKPDIDCDIDVKYQTSDGGQAQGTTDGGVKPIFWCTGCDVPYTSGAQTQAQTTSADPGASLVVNGAFPVVPARCTVPFFLAKALYCKECPKKYVTAWSALQWFRGAAGGLEQFTAKNLVSYDPCNFEKVYYGRVESTVACCDNGTVHFEGIAGVQQDCTQDDVKSVDREGRVYAQQVVRVEFICQDRDPCAKKCNWIMESDTLIEWVDEDIIKPQVRIIPVARFNNVIMTAQTITYASITSSHNENRTDWGKVDLNFPIVTKIDPSYPNVLTNIEGVPAKPITEIPTSVYNVLTGTPNPVYAVTEVALGDGVNWKYAYAGQDPLLDVTVLRDLNFIPYAITTQAVVTSISTGAVNVVTAATPVALNVITSASSANLPFITAISTGVFSAITAAPSASINVVTSASVGSVPAITSIVTSNLSVVTAASAISVSLVTSIGSQANNLITTIVLTPVSQAGALPLHAHTVGPGILHPFVDTILSVPLNNLVIPSYQLVPVLTDYLTSICTVIVPTIPAGGVCVTGFGVAQLSVCTSSGQPPMVWNVVTSLNTTPFGYATSYCTAVKTIGTRTLQFVTSIGVAPYNVATGWNSQQAYVNLGENYAPWAGLTDLLHGLAGSIISSYDTANISLPTSVYTANINIVTTVSSVGLTYISSIGTSSQNVITAAPAVPLNIVTAATAGNFTAVTSIGTSGRNVITSAPAVSLNFITTASSGAIPTISAWPTAIANVFLPPGANTEFSGISGGAVLKVVTSLPATFIQEPIVVRDLSGPFSLLTYPQPNRMYITQISNATPAQVTGIGTPKTGDCTCITKIYPPQQLTIHKIETKPTNVPSMTSVLTPIVVPDGAAQGYAEVLKVDPLGDVTILKSDPLGPVKLMSRPLDKLGVTIQPYMQKDCPNCGVDGLPQFVMPKELENEVHLLKPHYVVMPTGNENACPCYDSSCAGGEGRTDGPSHYENGAVGLTLPNQEGVAEKPCTIRVRRLERAWSRRCRPPG